MHETVQQKLSLLEQRVGPESKSPLFAQLASYYLLAGRAQDALRVCDEGIANFPFYTTGHLIKAKVLLTLNMSAEARRELEVVREILPTNETINKFLKDIPTPAGELPAQEAPGARTVKPKAKDATAPQPVSVAEPTPPPEPISPAAEVPPSEPSPTPFEAAPSGTDMFGLTASETPPSMPEPVATPEPTGAFEAAGQPPDDFGIAAPTPEEAAATPVAEPSSRFAGFEAEPPIEAPPEEPFAGLVPSAEPPAAQPSEMLPSPSEEESFEQYAARRRSEWAGMENTMSFEEYIGGASSSFGPAPAEEPPLTPPSASEPPSEIEDLAQKLQGAKKITPVINLSDKSTVAASESETPASTGFVTPTLAEIYAKQGWYDDAIKAYRTLAVNKPAEREKFEKRIQELEEKKKQQGG